MKKEIINKIAVIRRNGFGDFICAVPLIKYLEQCYPNAQITLFVDRRNYTLVPYFFSHLKHVMIPKGNKYWSLLKVGLKYRSEKFDLVISVKTSPMKLNNFFLALLGGKRRVAIVDDKHWHSKLINHPRQPHLYQDGHQALNCLRIFDPEIKSLESSLYPRLQLEQQPVKRPQSPPYLLVSVSNNFGYRTPSLTMLATVANQIYQRVPFSVFISCQSQDKDKALALQPLLNMESHVCDTPDLDCFLYQLNQADVVLAGDGGVCHFAASLNKSLVALYAKTKIENWGPLSKNAICIFDPLDVNNIPLADIEAAVEHFIRQAHAQRTCALSHQDDLQPSTSSKLNNHLVINS